MAPGQDEHTPACIANGANCHTRHGAYLMQEVCGGGNTKEKRQISNTITHGVNQISHSGHNSNPLAQNQSLLLMPCMLAAQGI